MKTTATASILGALIGLAVWFALDMLVPPPGVTATGGAFLIVVSTLFAAVGEMIVRAVRSRLEKK